MWFFWLWFFFCFGLGGVCGLVVFFVLFLQILWNFRNFSVIIFGAMTEVKVSGFTFKI